MAGFAPHQLEITVAGDQLCITGEQSRDGETRRLLRRGIGADPAGFLPIDLAAQAPDRVSRTIVIGARQA